MQYTIENGAVYASYETQNGGQVKYLYKPEYSIRLSSDKSAIYADGIDTATITATLEDYQGNTVIDNVTLDVTIGEVADTVDTVNGVVSFQVTTETATPLKIVVSYPSKYGVAILGVGIR